MPKRANPRECPHSQSCFNCPLPDCKAEGRLRYNPLPWELGENSEPKRKKSDVPYTAAEKAFIWEHRELKAVEISKLMHSELGVERTVPAIREMRKRLRRELAWQR